MRKIGKEISFKSLIFFEIITILFGIFVFTDLISIFPIIISCLYTYGTWQKNLKITYSIGTAVAIAWIFYNSIVGAYAGIIGCLFEFSASVIGLYKLHKIKE